MRRRRGPRGCGRGSAEDDARECSSGRAPSCGRWGRQNLSVWVRYHSNPPRPDPASSANSSLVALLAVSSRLISSVTETLSFARRCRFVSKAALRSLRREGETRRRPRSGGDRPEAQVATPALAAERYSRADYAAIPENFVVATFDKSPRARHFSTASCELPGRAWLRPGRVREPARRARWGSRQDPRSGSADRQDRSPSRCETEVRPASIR